jgi:hypothetical protein
MFKKQPKIRLEIDVDVKLFKKIVALFNEANRGILPGDNVEISAGDVSFKLKIK